MAKNNNPRCVYLAEFSDDYAYVGTTDNYEERIKEHLFTDKNSEVYTHKRHTGLIPKFSMLHDYTTIEESDLLEMNFTIKYASEGRRMLNRQKPGGFGGNNKTRNKPVSVRHNKKACIHDVIFYDKDIDVKEELTSVKEYMSTPVPLILEGIRWNTVDYRIICAIIEKVKSSLFETQDKYGHVHYHLVYNEDGYCELDIDFKDVCMSSKHYDSIEEGLQRLSDICVFIKDKNGIKVAMNLLNATVVYKNTNSSRRHYIKVSIHKSVSDGYFTVNNKVCHMKSIYTSCAHSYTPIIYLFLLFYRGHDIDFLVDYNYLRRVTGMYKFDSGGNIIEELYQRYKDFAKRVLEPSMKELAYLYDNGIIDMRFEYEPIHLKSNRGNPNKIHFLLELKKHIS